MFWILIIFATFVFCQETRGGDIVRLSRDITELRTALTELNKRMAEIDFQLKKTISDLAVLNTQLRKMDILPEIRLEQEKLKSDINKLKGDLEKLRSDYEMMKVKKEKEGRPAGGLEGFLFSPKFNIITFSIALFSLLVTIFT